MTEPTCRICDDTGIETIRAEDGDEYQIDCRGCIDACIRDDSTECDCSTCTAREEAFWREQQGGDPADEFDYGGEG